MAGGFEQRLDSLAREVRDRLVDFGLGADGDTDVVHARAVLKAARQMAADKPVDDGTFALLRSELGDEHLTDLVVTIAFYCGVVRLLATLGIDVEPEYAGYLEEFPLPR